MFVDLSGEYDFLHFFSLRYNLDSLQKTTVAKISEHCFLRSDRKSVSPSYAESSVLINPLYNLA